MTTTSAELAAYYPPVDGVEAVEIEREGDVPLRIYFACHRELHACLLAAGVYGEAMFRIFEDVERCRGACEEDHFVDAGNMVASRGLARWWEATWATLAAIGALGVAGFLYAVILWGSRKR